jgi:hypothetical protein
MTKLEQNCRLLLRAYPAQYRRQRGEEILGTLLETTPDGRTWPLARDVRGLLAGGLQARAVLNRRLPLHANVRTAVFVGLAAFLGYNAVAILSVYWSAESSRGHLALAAGAHLFEVGAAPSFGWGPLISPALTLITVFLAWVSGRRVVALVGALPAVTLMPWSARAMLQLPGPCRLELASVCGWPGTSSGAWVPEDVREIVWLACLGGLVAVTRRDERPGRAWVWPVVLISLSPALLAGGSSDTTVQVVTLLLLITGMAGIACIVVDARPTIAAAAFLLPLWLQTGVDYLGLVDWTVPLLVVGAVAAVAVWRLRGQSGRAPRRRAAGADDVFRT